jgi:hypothetical protein
VRYNVELSCEYSGCPGCWWRSQVWFIGNARSYRVWTQSDEDQTHLLKQEMSARLAPHAADMQEWTPSAV